MTASKPSHPKDLRHELAQLQAAFETLQGEHAEVLRQNEEVRRANAALVGETRTLKVERDLLKERLNAFLRKLFAARSEARGTEQKDLFFDEAEVLAQETQAEPAKEDGNDLVDVPAHRRAKRGRKPLDPNLPRDVVRIELPEGERVCSHDGSALVEIGVEASEQVHIIPQQLRVLRTERVKYACPCCDGSIKVSPAPARLIPKGLFTESTLAWIITAKYQDGLPLYRQAAILGRLGGEISRNTLAASVVKVGQEVQPIINLMRDHLLESDVVYADETTFQVLKEPGRSAQSKSYLWAQVAGSGPPIRLFAYAPSRSNETAGKLFAGIRPGAVLMSDGYDAYDQVARDYQLRHLGCWAHARRYVFDAEQALPKSARTPDQPAVQLLKAIAELYRIEKESRDVTPGERLRARQERAAPVLGQIEQIVLAHRDRVIPQSQLGKALTYLQGQWPKLTAYAGSGTWPIDNNLCENAIRPFVVGRKNWLHSDTVGGAHASANLYSLIETCKAAGIDPYRYLTALFAALPHAVTADDYDALLPWRLRLAPA